MTAAAVPVGKATSGRRPALAAQLGSGLLAALPNPPAVRPAGPPVREPVAAPR